MSTAAARSLSNAAIFFGVAVVFGLGCLAGWYITPCEAPSDLRQSMVNGGLFHREMFVDVVEDIKINATEAPRKEPTMSMMYEQLLHAKVAQAEQFIDYRPEKYFNLGHVAWEKGHSNWSQVSAKWKEFKTRAIAKSEIPSAVIIKCISCDSGPDGVGHIAATFPGDLPKDAKFVLVGRFDDNFGAFGQNARGLNGGSSFAKRPEADNVTSMLNDNRLIGWFTNQLLYTVHPKLISIPLGTHSSWNWAKLRPAYLNAREEGPAQRPNLVGVPFLPRGEKTFRSHLHRFATHQLRDRLAPHQSVVALGENHECSELNGLKPDECPGFEAYTSILRTSKFCLSPPGLGFDCYRTYETLLFGCIPVVLSSPLDRSFHGMPVLLVDSYDQLSERFLLDAEALLLQQLKNHSINLERLTMEYWQNLIRRVARHPYDALEKFHPIDIDVSKGLDLQWWFDNAWKAAKIPKADQKLGSVETIGFRTWIKNVTHRYMKLPKSDVPFSTLAQLPCPVNGCSLSEIMQACNANVECRAFNTNGSLKQYADCGWGSNHCVYPQGQPFPAADFVDLYIKQGLPPPAEWTDAVVDGTLLYSQPEPNICEMPEVGNGYVASVVGFSSTHVAGLYYGHCGNTHKARLPSPIAAISISNANSSLTQAGLDTVLGIYRRRYQFNCGAVVEQRILAHRVSPHVLMTEFELLTPPETGDPLLINLKTLYELQSSDVKPVLPSTNGQTQCPNPGGRVVRRPDGSTYPYYTDCPEGENSDCGECFVQGRCHCNVTVRCCQAGGIPPPPPLVGNGCAGTFTTTDFTWTDLSDPNSSSLLHTGVITSPNDDGSFPTVAIAVDRVHSQINLSSDAVVRYVAVVIASVGLDKDANITEMAVAEFSSLNVSRLLDQHAAAWTVLTSKRIEIGARNTNYRAWQLQTHFWSSYYYLLSTIRADWSLGGFSPGGLASQNYEGAVFMDQEFYMAQALLLFHPDLTMSAAQYRIDSAPAATRIAKTFGYDGMMFAWTSAAGGNPFGCCSGKGGFENCIEQHITPDVSFFLMQIFRASGDQDWLKTDAWPIVKGIADWITSRVVRDPIQNDVFHLRGVMPIDEWCNQASGCADPGVDDDPQMNGVTVAAIRWAIEAAGILGEDIPAIWRDVSAGLLIPYNKSLGGGVHTMPVGKNGISVLKAPRSTSCPEDVNYLSYPMGPMLNVSATLTRRDMQYYADGTKTCMENAGMTAPIHAISWLKTFPPNVTGAEFALNRSMLAVSYGPFNMRNEVDVHDTIVGGHFNNTHFLTGDGGYIQILLNGYGGLMLAKQDGMKLNNPVIPTGASFLKVSGMVYLNTTIDIWTDGVIFNINASKPGLCIFAPPAGTGATQPIQSEVLAVNIENFFWGGFSADDAHGKIGACTPQ